MENGDGEVDLLQIRLEDESNGGSASDSAGSDGFWWGDGAFCDGLKVVVWGLVKRDGGRMMMDDSGKDSREISKEKIKAGGRGESEKGGRG